MEEALNKIINSQSIYCYPKTDVLINKKNLQTKEELHEIERGITTYKLSKLYINEHPFKSNFNISHYMSIHKYLFEDIYEFAGSIRGESIYKDNEPYFRGKTPFCYPSHIYSNLDYILQEMNQNVYKIKDEEFLIKFLAHYYIEINAIHPFREGNGRTLREFFREYIARINTIIEFGKYEIKYSNLNDEDRKKLLKGTIEATLTDNTSLIEEIIGKVLSNLEKLKTR